MNDTDLADELISRLNRLLTDPEVVVDIHRLIENRVRVCDATQDHPTIQTQECTLGFLGLLNGLVGVIPAGERRQGWGFIAAEIGDDGKLARFVRTDARVTSP